MYIIWKASIENYRVLNTLTGEIKIIKDFIAKDCEFKVNINGFNTARLKNFENSGKPNDYFAYIVAKKVLKMPRLGLFKRKMQPVFYNPFKSAYFRNRITGERVDFCNTIRITGNTLAYN